jgi:hypothetical protein
LVTVFVIVIIDNVASAEIAHLVGLLSRDYFRLLLVERSCGLLIIIYGLNASELMSAISKHDKGLSLGVLACRLLP